MALKLGLGLRPLNASRGGGGEDGGTVGCAGTWVAQGRVNSFVAVWYISYLSLTRP